MIGEGGFRRGFLFAFWARWLFAAPVALAQTSNVPYPRYLKVWNDSFTHEEALSRLQKLKLSPEFLVWYRKTAAARPALHRSSVEFLDRDQFFLKSESGQLNLINTSRMAEGQLLILRKPFNFSRDESLAAIGDRLTKWGGRRTSPAYWAPVLAIIDAERKAGARPLAKAPGWRAPGRRAPVTTEPGREANGLR